jgi:hypothetical protein
MHCENPQHKQHLKRFLKKYPTADKNGEFPIITVNPEDWAIDLEHPEKNTVKCCQMCSSNHWNGPTQEQLFPYSVKVDQIHLERGVSVPVLPETFRTCGKGVDRGVS